MQMGRQTRVARAFSPSPLSKKIYSFEVRPRGCVVVDRACYVRRRVCVRAGDVFSSPVCFVRQIAAVIVVCFSTTFPPFQQIPKGVKQGISDMHVPYQQRP